MNNETKRRKNKPSINKAELWNQFDNAITNEDKTGPLECIYRASGNREYCDHCENTLAFSDEGFLTCTNSKCGIIYKDMLDNSAEWRFYGADDNHGDDPTRCGMPINPLLQESSFGCKVLCSNNTSYEMRKIRRYTEWQSMPYKEKSQYDEFQRITTMAQNAGIPKMIIDDAVRYHKKISDHDLSFRGLNRDGILAASIYMSCRINSNPRTAKEIANVFHLDVTSATRGCKNAQMIVNSLEKDLNNNEKTSFCQATPHSFIERYCSKLSMNAELTKLCQFVSIKIEAQGMMLENTPNSIAAGIIYFIAQVCLLNITKRDVKNVSNTSEVTINKCYKKIDKLTEQLIPPAIIKKYSIVVSNAEKV
jgi:transcription initiation factor TFIIB|tara:strand:+ start:3183 stop:4274 length:1092 start_codon:yes stop_codon:yes gene_type:complete